MSAAPGAPELPRVRSVLEEGVRGGVAPGMSAVVLRGGALVHSSFHGHAALLPEPRPLRAGDHFDVASVTKVMATTTLAALHVERGELPLDARAAELLPGFGASGKGEVTVRQLLAHSSGLPAVRPYFERAMCDPVAAPAFLPPSSRPRGADLARALERSREVVIAALFAEPLEAAPGTRAVYSDLGYIALGLILERLGGESLDRLCERLVFRRTGLANSFFIDERSEASGDERSGASRQRTFVATERCEHRGEVNCGSVNDDNAYALGGVAGHAGLFSTAREVAALGQVWLDALHGRGARLAAPTAARFAARAATPGSERTLGWDTPTPGRSSLGTRLGRGRRGAIGHIGFTGTTLWVDLDEEVVVVLLTNRVHPTRANEKIKQFRPRFHDAVAEALGI